VPRHHLAGQWLGQVLRHADAAGDFAVEVKPAQVADHQHADARLDHIGQGFERRQWRILATDIDDQHAGRAEPFQIRQRSLEATAMDLERTLDVAQALLQSRLRRGVVHIGEVGRGIAAAGLIQRLQRRAVTERHQFPPAAAVAAAGTTFTEMAPAPGATSELITGRGVGEPASSRVTATVASRGCGNVSPCPRIRS
jgi:hypothetical protein